MPNPKPTNAPKKSVLPEDPRDWTVEHDLVIFARSRRLLAQVPVAALERMQVYLGEIIDEALLRKRRQQDAISMPSVSLPPGSPPPAPMKASVHPAQGVLAQAAQGAESKR